jgi:alpha-1,2-mannosyltransferase
MRINFSDKFYINASMVLWFIFIVAICVIVGKQGESRTVTTNYLDAANLWMHGKALYNSTGRGFIYLPQSAVLFIPFAYLSKFSFAAAEIVWRLVSLLLLIYALWHFASLVDKKFVARTFFIVTAATLPLVFSSARNGQFNTILEVLMLFAVCSIAKEQWFQAVFYLVLGFALKPTMVVLLLLLWGLYRPLWWRLPLGLFAVLIFPFFTQEPHYVIAQYLGSIDMLQIASTVGSNNTDWAQIFGLLAQLKLMPTQLFQDLIRVIVAIFVFYSGVLVKQKFNKNHAAIFLYALATIYLMLFNPRTEGNDYGIVAPAIGVFISLFLACDFKKQMWLLVFTIGGLIMSGNLTFIMGSGDREFWSAPFFALVFAIIVIVQIFIPSMFLQNQNKTIL